MDKKTAIVVGAGLGGLSIACYLAKDGYKVTVLEKHDQVGGRARVWKEKGYTFDMGPSWYLMPEIFDRFFSDFGKKTSDYYSIRRLDPSYRIFYGDSEFSDVHADLEKNKMLFESVEPGAGQQLQAYLDAAEYQYSVAVKKFLYREYKTIFDFFDWRLITEGWKLNIFENIDHYTRRFFKNDKLRKKLEYSMVFLGGAPKNTPALYSLISHTDFNLGVWYPDGGIGVVAHAMESLARELGVTFKFDNEVSRIIVENGRATGVVTNGERIDGDVVVVNADYHFSETKLLEPQFQTYPEKYWESATVAPSGFILYLGVNKKLSKLQHHSLFFENDWMKHFDRIFDNPDWPEAPSYYVCAPSKTDPTVAPEGKEAVFVLVPVAAGLTDDDSIREAYANKIISHLEGLLGESIQDSIEVKRIYSHRDFISDYHSYKGTGLGLSHTILQTAVFRPKHESKKVKDLYYTGQYTHPGIGMPMVLISSWVVADEMRKKYGKQ